MPGSDRVGTLGGKTLLIVLIVLNSVIGARCGQFRRIAVRTVARGRSHDIAVAAVGIAVIGLGDGRIRTHNIAVGDIAVLVIYKILPNPVQPVNIGALS